MCHDPTIANMWKCRVLIGVEYEESEAPQFAVVPLKDMNVRQKSQPFLNLQPFQVQLMFGCVILTPEDSKEYSLLVQIANHTFSTGKGVMGKNFIRFNELKPQQEIALPYSSVEDIGFVFLYLCDSKGEKLSFGKFPAAQFMDPNPKLQWVELTPDPVIKKIESPEKGGFCSFRLAIAKGASSQVVPFSTMPEWKKGLGKRPPPNKIRAFIYQARDLPAADEDGQSDPLLRLFDMVQTSDKKPPAETRVVEDTLYPMYYQCLEIIIDGQPDELPPFVIDVYDEDKQLIGKPTRDYMCRCVIPVKDASMKIIKKAAEDDGRPPPPTWHKCYFKQGQKACGEILISFILADDGGSGDLKWKVPSPVDVKMMGVRNNIADQNAVVQFDEFNIEINVLGLRSLVSSGLLPVKKAYVQFGLKTLVPPLVGATIEDIMTTPGPSGPDPTINTIVSFRMLLPEDPQFSPSMACRVFDKIFKGFDGQLIGVFTIPIGEIMHEQRSRNLLLRSKLKNLIEELQNFRDEKAVPTYFAIAMKDDSKDPSFRKDVQSGKDITKKVFAEDTKKGMSAEQQLMAQT